VEQLILFPQPVILLTFGTSNVTINNVVYNIEVETNEEQPYWQDSGTL
jgi:hypothetical protein